MSEQDPQSFIQTPLEFFGHSADDIYFGYPDAYHTEMADALQQLEETIAQMEARHTELAAGAEPTPEDRYLVSDEAYQDELNYLTHKASHEVNHHWYEKRFRGRYGTDVKLDKYPDLVPFLHAINDWDYEPDKTPYDGPIASAETFAAYFNEAILCNEWQSVHYEALQWHTLLAADNPDRETAAMYVSFAGNIVLQEYCRLAVAFADDKLAGDDFLSVKHLLTVCWPTAMRLEPFIPEEVSRAKQLLRETFLQMAARGSSSFRSHVELFGWAILGQDQSVGSRDENEDQAYQVLMGFEDRESMDLENIRQNLLDRAQNLALKQRWEAAIDILELSTHAFGFPLEDFQLLIDQYAIEGALHYTQDMSKMDEMWMEQRGAHQIPTCNAYMLTGITMQRGISEEAHQKMYDIKDTRELEYNVQQLSSAPADRRAPLVMDLLFKLSQLPKDISGRFASPEITEQFMDILLHEKTARATDSALDSIIEAIVRLHNNGVLTTDQQNTALMALGDAVLEQAAKPDRETFSRFIGYISPLLRITPTAEKPPDEVIWRLISPERLASFFDAIHLYAVEQNDEDSDWYLQQKAAFMSDIRAAWEAYWDERQEY